jgi:diketogulonate reductase-like aldo/keto reductase
LVKKPLLLSMKTSPPNSGINRREALRFLGAATLAVSGARLGGAEEKDAPTTGVLLKRTIPGTREEVPVIGLGTWQTFDVGESDGDRAPLEAVLREFAALGGRVIDSSPMYGRSEEVAGDLMAKLGLQEKLFVATKVWTSGQRAGIEQMETSMRKLRVPRIDLMQVHNLVDTRAHLETLRAWKREGRVRYLGVTHYTASGAEAVAKLIASETVDFIQINYSVAERDAEKRLLPLAKERGVAVIANRPLAGGELIRKLRSQPLPGWAAEIECTSWAQVLLKFVISHPAMTVAIPATSKVEHLRDNLRAGMGRLPDEGLREKIAEAVSKS